jgi:hypothetical protein
VAILGDLRYLRGSLCGEKAKENRGQLIENKRSGEILQFRAPMISTTCGPFAQPLVSRSETIPFVFAVFGLRAGVRGRFAKQVF